MLRETSTRRAFLGLGGTALATGLAGCAGLLPGPDTDTTSSTAPQTGEQSALSQSTRERAEGTVYTEVYRDTIPSVVLVKTPGGQGTGWCYDETHVVTNAHVVGTAPTAQVRFADGSWREGTVRGTDAHSDLAVISVEPPDSTAPLSLASTRPVPGQEVVAIGNPYNLDGTLTTGIVSGTNRLIPSPTGYEIPDAIQTDAAVNPGNSGGPLMSLDGTVVGVVNSRRGDNIAFGISAQLTRRVVPRLVETGEYEHAYVGASFEQVTPRVAAANGLDEARGLILVQTVRGGPADGVLRPSRTEFVEGRRVPVGGDVLWCIEGTPVDSFEDLASFLALQTRPGDTVSLTVRRDGSTRSIGLPLGARPERSQSPLR